MCQWCFRTFRLRRACDRVHTNMVLAHVSGNPFPFMNSNESKRSDVLLSIVTAPRDPHSCRGPMVCERLLQALSRKPGIRRNALSLNGGSKRVASVSWK